MRAGLDVDCAFGAGITLDINTVRSALRLGVITMDDVDTALRHLFMVRMRLGHFVSARSSFHYAGHTVASQQTRQCASCRILPAH